MCTSPWSARKARVRRSDRIALGRRHWIVGGRHRDRWPCSGARRACCWSSRPLRTTWPSSRWCWSMLPPQAGPCTCAQAVVQRRTPARICPAAAVHAAGRGTARACSAATRHRHHAAAAAAIARSPKRLQHRWRLLRQRRRAMRSRPCPRAPVAEPLRPRRRPQGQARGSRLLRAAQRASQSQETLPQRSQEGAPAGRRDGAFHRPFGWTHFAAVRSAIRAATNCSIAPRSN